MRVLCGSELRLSLPSRDGPMRLHILRPDSVEGMKMPGWSGWTWYFVFWLGMALIWVIALLLLLFVFNQ